MSDDTRETIRYVNVLSNALGDSRLVIAAAIIEVARSIDARTRKLATGDTKDVLTCEDEDGP